MSRVTAPKGNAPKPQGLFQARHSPAPGSRGRACEGAGSRRGEWLPEIGPAWSVTELGSNRVFIFLEVRSDFKSLESTKSSSEALFVFDQIKFHCVLLFCVFVSLC